MDRLVEENAELRNDLIRQNQLISQIKRKVYGPEVDCYEHNQLPESPAAVAPWYPATAEGLFFVYNGATALHVKLSDYREMVDHYVLVMKSLPQLYQEKLELKAGLQLRKTINNELVVKMLRGEVKEEEKIEQKRLDDVD